MNLVLISGKAGAGKDSFCNYALREILDNEVKQPERDRVPHKLFRFSEPIKDLAEKSFGWDREKDTRGRQLLIDLGRAGVKYDKYIWARAVDHKIQISFNEKRVRSTVFIPDCRFSHEIDYFACQTKTFSRIFLVRIERSGLSDESFRTSPSEVELDNFPHFTYKFSNDSSLEVLEKNAKTVVKELLESHLRDIPKTGIVFWQSVFQ